jgi:hypothetical protein
VGFWWEINIWWENVWWENTSSWWENSWWDFDGKIVAVK